MQKTCPVCLLDFPLTPEFFHKSKKGKYGLNSYCKSCANINSKNWSAANKKKKAETDKAYAEKKKDEIAAYQKEYRQKNKVEANAYNLKYRSEKKDILSEKKKEYYAKDQVIEKRKAYLAERKAKDGKFRMICSVRSAVSEAMRGSVGALRHLPYDIKSLRNHMERQFQKGMTWENYGKVWHVDHIIPLSSFKISGPNCSEFIACWALSNLRPFWASENMSKQSKRTHLI